MIQFFQKRVVNPEENVQKLFKIRYNDCIYVYLNKKVSKLKKKRIPICDVMNVLS